MKENQGLYRQQFEHDNCGIGAVINSKGIKSHTTVENALKIVENTGASCKEKIAEGKTGDGVGILLQISQQILTKKNVTNWGSRSERRESMVSPSSSSHRMN